MKIDWLAGRANLTPNRNAVVDPKFNRKWSYEQLNQRAVNLAAYLRQQDVGYGDRVVLIAQNSISHLDFLFACTKLGAIFTPINWRLKENELMSILNDNQPVIVAYESDFRYPFYYQTEHFRLIDVDSVKYDIIVNNDKTTEFRNYPVQQEDPAVIIYTSGSTGQPKGAMISHRAMISNALNSLPSWGITKDDRTITISPMFHTAGLFSLVTPLLMAGGELIIQPTFEATLTFELVKEYQPTKIFMVPTMYYDLMNTQEIDISEMTSVDLFVSGGAPMSSDVYDAFNNADLPLIDSYGLTEAGPNNFWIAPAEASTRRGSVGKPIMFSDILLVDEANEEVAPGEIGELLIAGNHTFSGYWNNEEATKEAFYKHYVRTGDFAKVDEEGNYSIVGRKKEMIITGGENVYPSEVEEVVIRHQLIHDVIVVGYPNKKWGESVAAAVILNEPSVDAAMILAEYCKTRLAVHKVPKFYLEFNEFPRNSVGKIDKPKITKMILEAVEGQKV